MKKQFIYFLITLLVAGISSCVKEIQLDLPPYKTKLVVNGEMNNNETVSLEVSQSYAVLSDDSTYILSDATAKLYEDNAFIGTMSYFDLRYIYNYKPIPGKKYRIEVTHPKFDPVTVNVEVPATVPATASYIDSVGLDNQGFPIGQLTVSFKDNPSQKNYYEFLIRYYDAGIMKWFPLDIASNDPVFLNNEKQDNGGYSFSDATFNGANKVIKIPVIFGTVNGTPKFEISIKSVGEEYFRYMEQVREYESNRSNFDITPIIMNSNVNNGLGMVGGVSNFKDTLK